MKIPKKNFLGVGEGGSGLWGGALGWGGGQVGCEGRSEVAKIQKKKI